MEPTSKPPTSKSTRQMRFQPKAPPVRSQRLVVAKVEKVEDDFDAVEAQEKLRRLNELHLNEKPKRERKVEPASVAFGQGGSALKSYGAHTTVKSSQTIYPGGVVRNRVDKEYKEPWDYNHSYYPVSLPLRRLYSGDPELLDEDEFGQASKSLTYDEGSGNAAVQFGLLEENPEPTLLFLQLPSKLPMPKDPKDVKEASIKPRSSRSNVYTLDELQAGFMGKLLVYKSGDVKLKLGDKLYDVSTGVDSTFAQEVDVVNTEKKLCCSIGELNKRLIVTPDIDSIFGSL